MLDEFMDQKMKKEKYILDHFDEALEKEWIKDYYQVIVRSWSGKISDVEVFCRWIDPECGVIMPNEFIPILEKANLIHRLDLYMLRKVCKHMRKFMEQNEKVIPLCLNLSIRDFGLCDMPSEIEAIRKEYGVTVDYLHFEIEGPRADKYQDDIVSSFRVLKDMGYQLWIDHFVANETVIFLLKEYGIHAVKINMKYFCDAIANYRSRVMLRAIIYMMKELGVTTIATFVENEGEYQFLRELGCEKVQGYYFEKPIPVEEVIRMYATNEVGTIEDMTSEEYNEKVSRINLMNKHEVGESEDLPTAIVEWSNQTFRYLYTNKKFRETLYAIGISSLEASEKLVETGDDDLRDRMKRLFEKAREEAKPVLVDTDYRGQRVSFRIRFVAEDPRTGAQSFVIMKTNQVEFSRIWKNKKLQDSLESLCSLYNRIDLISPDGEYIDNIYRRSTSVFGRKRVVEEQQTLDAYIATMIMVEDQVRFKDFFDIRHLQESMEDREKKYATAYFRALREDGSYSWQFFTAIPYEVDGQNTFLACSTEVNPAVSEYASKYALGDYDVEHGITHQQLEQRMSALENIFEVVRLVNPMLECEIYLDENGEVVESTNHCFEVWGKDGRCKNCTSLKAYQAHSTFSKFEYIGSDVFFVISQYLMVDGRPYVLEMVREIRNELSEEVFQKMLDSGRY